MTLLQIVTTHVEFFMCLTDDIVSLTIDSVQDIPST